MAGVRTARWGRLGHAKPLLLAGVLLALGTTRALAENWLTVQSPSLTAMYDAGRVCAEAATDLVYVATCEEMKCGADDTGRVAARDRYDCATRTEALCWDPLARQSAKAWTAGDNEYLPGSSAAITMDAVCAKKDS